MITKLFVSFHILRQSSERMRPHINVGSICQKTIQVAVGYCIMSIMTQAFCLLCFIPYTIKYYVDDGYIYIHGMDWVLPIFIRSGYNFCIDNTQLEQESWIKSMCAIAALSAEDTRDEKKSQPLNSFTFIRFVEFGCTHAKMSFAQENNGNIATRQRHKSFYIFPITTEADCCLRLN